MGRQAGTAGERAIASALDGHFFELVFDTVKGEFKLRDHGAYGFEAGMRRFEASQHKAENARTVEQHKRDNLDDGDFRDIAALRKRGWSWRTIAPSYGYSAQGLGGAFKSWLKTL